MKKFILIFASVIMTLLFSSSVVSAHVVVKPSQVGIGAFQTFTIGVPNEKDQPTSSLRLVIPDGLKYVSPNVKPGWNIEIKKTGEGENAKVTEIIWTGGSIPVGQRDDFMFSAQVPSSETKLTWKAYQTYSDGQVVSWDQTPSKEEKDDDAANNGPYSETKIINDLQTTPTPETTNKTAFTFSLIALSLAAVSLALQLRKKEQNSQPLRK